MSAGIGITFALCSCDDQLHDELDHEPWVESLDEAKQAAVFYPAGTVHYLRRLVTVTPMRGAA